MQHIASFLDHTALKPTVTASEIEQLCAEALQYGFKTVCVPPSFVQPAARILKGSVVGVSTVVGFPLGYQTTSTKLSEVEQAHRNGAAEVDVVMNISRFKSANYAFVEEEIRKLSSMAHTCGMLIKLIIETAYLAEEEIKKACEICVAAGVDFVKTSTGFAPQGAQAEQIRQLRAYLPAAVAIKASGGIKTYEQALQMIEAGASRLGTSSGVEIMKQAFR